MMNQAKELEAVLLSQIELQPPILTMSLDALGDHLDLMLDHIIGKY